MTDTVLFVEKNPLLNSQLKESILVLNAVDASVNIIESIPGKLPSNYKMAEINALAGNLILSRYDVIITKRRNNYNRIINELKDYEELIFQKINKNFRSAYHLIPAFFDGKQFNKNNDDLISDLYEKYSIKCVVHTLK